MKNSYLKLKKISYTINLYIKLLYIERKDECIYHFK